MRRIGLLTAVAFAALLPLAAYAEDPTVIASPATLKWAAAPPALPKGAQLAVLFGDPTKEGQFAIRAKFPSGWKIGPHTHPNDESVTVISGTLHIGFGDKPDPAKANTITAGGFFHIPKGTPHYAWVTGATVIQNNSVGPGGYTYINAADDPRNKK